jgi:hypothetical protein
MRCFFLKFGQILAIENLKKHLIFALLIFIASDKKSRKNIGKILSNREITNLKMTLFWTFQLPKESNKNSLKILNLHIWFSMCSQKKKKEKKG